MTGQNRIESLRELRDWLRDDWSVNDRSLFRPGFQAMFMYRFGVWRMSIRRRWMRMPFSALYKLMHIWVRNFYGIELHYTATIGRRLRIAHQSGIILHSEAVLGDDCLIRQGVSIGRAANHGEGVHAAAPVLGDRVEVGAGALLAGAITIGDDVVIGPNAVVLSNVPPGSIVAVTPARVIPRPKSIKKPERQQAPSSDNESR